MSTTFRYETHQDLSKKKVEFDADAELREHAWYPEISALEAEDLLRDRPPYTYLTRPCDFDRGFMISFVDMNGNVKHDHFSLIDPIHGIWRNFYQKNVGTLFKVVRDLMECSFLEGQPLR